MVLLKDGNLEIYIMDFVIKNLCRIICNCVIDIEFVWLLDGSGLIFSLEWGGKF